MIDTSTLTTAIAARNHVVAFAMAALAELRESDTESHILRVGHYIRMLANELAQVPLYAPVLTADYIERLVHTASVYDLGNIAVPDKILLKPGRLLPDEVEIMRTHTVLGYEALQRAQKTLGLDSIGLEVALEVTLSHHERWDGSGYPHSLKAEGIPLSARIVALADVYDALITSKVYKAGVSHEEACAKIAEGKGLDFAPDVVDAFLRVEAGFRHVASKFADTEADMQRRIEFMANAIAEKAEL